MLPLNGETFANRSFDGFLISAFKQRLKLKTLMFLTRRCVFKILEQVKFMAETNKKAFVANISEKFHLRKFNRSNKENNSVYKKRKQMFFVFGFSQV